MIRWIATAIIREIGLDLGGSLLSLFAQSWHSETLGLFSRRV